MKPKGNVTRLVPAGTVMNDGDKAEDRSANDRLFVTDTQYTYDELVALFDAFANKDPDKNGKKDTYGLSEATLAVTFDLPAKAVALRLIPYSDAKRGFSGLIPDGWKNLQESNMMRASTALDPAYFVLEAQPGRAASNRGSGRIHR